MEEAPEGLRIAEERETEGGDPAEEKTPV